MKACFLLAFALLVSSGSAQSAMLRANMTSIDIQRCRQVDSKQHEIHLGGSLEIENMSDATVLVPRKVDVVRTVTFARSQSDAEVENYLCVMNQEFGVNAKAITPSIDSFTAVRPGKKALVKVDPTVIPASADFNNANPKQLQSGKYWLQLKFLPLPDSLLSSNTKLDVWQERWRSFGVLSEEYILTRPFAVDVTLDLKAPRCEPY